MLKIKQFSQKISYFLVQIELVLFASRDPLDHKNFLKQLMKCFSIYLISTAILLSTFLCGLYYSNLDVKIVSLVILGLSSIYFSIKIYYLYDSRLKDLYPENRSYLKGLLFLSSFFPIIHLSILSFFIFKKNNSNIKNEPLIFIKIKRLIPTSFILVVSIQLLALSFVDRSNQSLMFGAINPSVKFLSQFCKDILLIEQVKMRKNVDYEIHRRLQAKSLDVMGYMTIVGTVLIKMLNENKDIKMKSAFSVKSLSEVEDLIRPVQAYTVIKPYIFRISILLLLFPMSTYEASILTLTESSLEKTEVEFKKIIGNRVSWIENSFAKSKLKSPEISRRVVLLRNSYTNLVKKWSDPNGPRRYRTSNDSSKTESSNLPVEVFFRNLFL